MSHGSCQLDADAHVASALGALFLSLRAQACNPLRTFVRPVILSCYAISPKNKLTKKVTRSPTLSAQHAARSTIASLKAKRWAGKA